MALLLEAASVHDYVLITGDTKEAEDLNHHGQADWLKTQKWTSKDGSDLSAEAITELYVKLDEVNLHTQDIITYKPMINS